MKTSRYVFNWGVNSDKPVEGLAIEIRRLSKYIDVEILAGDPVDVIEEEVKVFLDELYNKKVFLDELYKKHAPKKDE